MKSVSRTTVSRHFGRRAVAVTRCQHRRSIDMRSPRRLAVGLALTSALAAPTAAPARTADLTLPAHATAAKRADLVVAAVGNPPASLRANEAFAVGLKVANKGKAKARKSAVRFYLGAGATKDVRVDGVAVTKALRARKRGRATARLTAPGYLAPGSYRLFACADDLKKVRESNERNNCAVSKGRAVVRGHPRAPSPSGPAGAAAPPATPPSSPPGGDQPAPGPTPEPPEGNDPKELEKGAVTSLRGQRQVPLHGRGPDPAGRRAGRDRRAAGRGAARQGDLAGRRPARGRAPHRPRPRRVRPHVDDGGRRASTWSSTAPSSTSCSRRTATCRSRSRSTRRGRTTSCSRTSCSRRSTARRRRSRSAAAIRSRSRRARRAGLPAASPPRCCSPAASRRR